MESILQFILFIYLSCLNIPKKYDNTFIDTYIPMHFTCLELLLN